MTSDNQRNAERVRTSIDCYWGLTPDCPRGGTITSLSAQGCFITTKAAASGGQTVYAKCWLPTGRWLPLRGTVLYHLARVGIGLRFTDLADGHEEMIGLLLEYFRDENAG